MVRPLLSDSDMTREDDNGYVSCEMAGAFHACTRRLKDQ